MIRYFYRNTKSQVRQLEELAESKKGAWIYVENPTEAEIEQLVERFDLEAGHIQDALDVDEVPRFEVEEDQNYIFTRFVYTDSSGQVDTVTLLIITSPNFFITISTARLPQLDRMINGRFDVTTTQRTKLLLQLLNQIVSAYDTQLSAIGRQIKATRSRLRVEDIRNQDFINFVAIEDQVDDFLSALAPTNAILRRLLTGKHLKLFEEDKDLLEDLLLNTEQSIESCRTSVKTIVNIREAYSTIMGNNLNRVIRQLTVLTVIMTVPTIVSGIYGMNVALPFEGTPWAFAFVIMLILGISGFLLLIFRRQRWF